MTPGTNFDVTWVANRTIRPVASVNLSYSLDGGATWKKIDMSADPSNDGSFSWTIPPVTTDKTKCKVKILLKDSANNSVGSDMSDSVFTIQAP
jgi:hypothetical protein